MQIKPDAAKVIDLSTRFETLPVETDVGPVLWADVEITYTLAGLTPTVAIRVPVPFETGDSDAKRKSQALRNARLLIDHACQAAGGERSQFRDSSQSVADVLDGAMPTVPEGVLQELGFATPTANPRSKTAT